MDPHDHYCDQQHTARQPCNDALRGPASAPVEAPSALPMLEALPPEITPVEPPPVATDDRRAEAREAAAAPPGGPYVMAELSRTVTAIDRTRSDGPAFAEDDPDFEQARGGGNPAAVAVAAIALIAVMLFVLRRRARDESE